MSDYEIDYDELRKIYRLESKSQKLSKLDDEFYKVLKKFINSEKIRYNKALENFSATDIKNFENLKKLVLKIRELRIKKCMNLCLVYGRTNDLSEENLIDFEVDFVKNILKLMDKQTEYTEQLFGIKKIKNEKDLDLVKVEVLQNIPAFIGSDMNEYGPFGEQEVCMLPENVYKILSAKKIVKKID